MATKYHVKTNKGNTLTQGLPLKDDSTTKHTAHQIVFVKFLSNTLEFVTIYHEIPNIAFCHSTATGLYTTNERNLYIDQPSFCLFTGTTVIVFNYC
jgi:hypothetical protein